MATYREVAATFALYAFLNMFLNWWNSWALSPEDKQFKFPFYQSGRLRAAAWSTWLQRGFKFSFFYSWFHSCQ